MARASFAGTTDYTHQSLDDIVGDLTAEVENTRTLIKQIESSVGSSQESGYWDANVPLAFKQCVGYALKHYRTVVSEVEDILADFAVEIKEHHCCRLYNIAAVAAKINVDIGRVWHRDYLDKDYGEPEFDIVEVLYQRTRGGAVDLLDFLNMATRLEHFVGRTKTVASNPWISGSFYMFAVVLLLAVLAAIANRVSWYALPVIVIGGALLIGIVGALQLRNDDKLKEKNFLALMAEIYKRLPLLKHEGKKGSA